MLVDRVPPFNLEAEQAVLGSMLLSREAIYSTAEILRPEDFYRDAHRLAYHAILDLNDRGQAVDLLTVSEELRRRGELEKVGGAAYVASLASAVPTAVNAVYYAKITAEKALLREVINAGSSIVEQGYGAEGDVSQLLDRAEQLVFNIAQRRRRGGPFPLKDILAEAFANLEKLSRNRDGVTGIPTFGDLDRFLSGMQKSDLIICAARPGMGKTSFCLNIAQSAAVRGGTPVAVFSLEMSKEQVALRMLAADAMVDQHKLRTGYLVDEDWSRLVSAVGPLAEAPIFIDDTPAATSLEIRAKARRLKAEQNLGLVIVDYLQLMVSPRRVESRQQEIAQISRSLKALARELEIPVLVLSQLNRGVEGRQDKRPVMADLLESGAIEADADVILFLYRPEYYDRDCDRRGIAEVIISKHRNGPVGTVELGFLAEFTKFVDLAPEEYQE